jgi:hypothetical protein
VEEGQPRRAWQIRIELKRISPQIWRRVLVLEKTTLLRLHEVIQDVFGWWDYHLHEFQIHGRRYGDPENDEYGDLDLQDEAEAKLHGLGLREGGRFEYVYDFGDNWEHSLWVEEIRTVDKRTRLPSCLGGGRACPPEDVGGVGGYAEFLEAIADSEHPQHDQYLTWVGGAFDPEAFVLAEANRRLRFGPSLRRGSPWHKPMNTRYIARDAREDTAPRTEPVPAEHESTACVLALRKDVGTLLEYLRNHRVAGTSSTGNLPMKAIAGIAAGFVEPPALELRIGSYAHPFRSEEEVQPVFFAHLLARGAELLEGAASRRWRLTEQGEAFLARPAFGQVLRLLGAWWHRVDWQMLLRHRPFAEEHALGLPKIVRSLIEQLPVGQAVDFEEFVDRLIEKAGWRWEKPEPYDVRGAIASAVERIVVRPLAEFGIVATQRTGSGKEGPLEWSKTVAFSLTAFGQALFRALG